MTEGLDLDVIACRIRLSARQTLRFPPVAANTFRGALGFVLAPEWFRPVATAGPSGLRARPRPFVLRANHLDCRVIEPGEQFELTLNLFTPAACEPFQAAFDQVADAGITAVRSRLDILEWDRRMLRLDLAPRTGAPSAVAVEFLTPTELKGAPDFEPPPFNVLAARLRDRVSSLRAFYGDGPLRLDHAGLVARAGEVTMIHADVAVRKHTRLSTRTGLIHPLGGFHGRVDYAGPLAEFLPFLEAGHWTGVGRQTVWGKGWIRATAI